MDETISNEWKEDAQEHPNFTERMAKYCIDELRWRAKELETTGFVFVFNGDVVKSDVAVSAEMKERLQAAVGKLEAISKGKKDYRPNSDDKVWDLVHPSLFPLV